MPPEELLAAALRGDAAPWPVDAGAGAATALFDVAREQGVAALLAAAPALRRWPDVLQQDLRDARRRDAVVEALRRENLRRVLMQFHQAGVHCLVIKGAQLAYTHYAQPWLRPRFDTDLLIGPGNRDRADAVLRGLGYAPLSHVSGTLVTHQQQYERDDRYGLTDNIDLHWKLTNPHLFADTLTLDELMTAARPLPELGEHARGPSNVHALLLACVHRVAHHQNSDLLIWLYDIHVLFSAMAPEEREEFVELARVKGLRSICAAGLDSARRRFGTPDASRWIDGLRAGGDGEPTAAFLRHDLRRVDILFSDLRMVDGWTGKLRLIAEHLFPPAAYMRARYGPDTPLFFAYIDRVVTGVGKWFRLPS